MVASGARIGAVEDRDFALNKTGRIEHPEVLGNMDVGEAGKSFDLLGGARSARNGLEDGDVVMRFGDKILEQQARLGLHQVVGGEKQVFDVLGQGLVLVDALPVGRDAAEDGI